MASKDNNNRITDVKITVLGGGGVGKTAFTVQLVSHHFVEYYDPTIESSYRQQFIIDEEVAVLDILDTAGQEEFTALQAQWIRSGEGFIILYSIDDHTSFDEVQNFRTKILNVKDVEASNAPPTVLVGNKCDLTTREVSTKAGQELATAMGCDFFEASAKTRHNVQESVFQLVRRIREKRNSKGTTGGGGMTPLMKKKKCILF